MSIQNINDQNFKSLVLDPGGRVLVDFWSPSCAPCVGIGRRLEQRASDFEGRLTIYKMNADESIETAAHYGVRGLPVLILIKDGKHVDSRIGALSPTKIDELLLKWASF